MSTGNSDFVNSPNMLTGQNDGNNGMIAASLADMQKVRDEEKAALLELFGQQTNRMNMMNMNMGGGMPQNQHSNSNEGNANVNPDVSAAAADYNGTSLQQINRNMAMNPMMMNQMIMMNNQMMMAAGMNGMGMNNLMNFDTMTPQQQAMMATMTPQQQQQAMMASTYGPNMNMNMNMLQAPQEDPGWEEQFFALKAYQRETGHCKVPARFKTNPKLGRWVMTQRRQFTLLMQGYPSALTAERIQRLEGIGFTWSIRPEPVKTWNRKFQELKTYKSTFGNCMVPQRYQANPQLGTWVHTQRRQYKLMIEGKKSSMTREKVQALDSIGFFWAAKPSSRSVNKALPVQHDVQIGQPVPLNNAMGFVQQK